MSSLEVVKRIVDAEKQSQDLLEKTKLEIAELKRNVPSKIAAMRQEILRQSDEDRKKALAEAERRGAQEADKIAAESRNKIETLSKIPREKHNQAIEAAVKLLTS